MTPTAKTRVILVDDHEIMRDGLREVLQRSGAYDVVGEAGDGETAVKVARSVKPDVVIMDVMMPVKSGIDACREITETLPSAKVLILTAASEEDAVMEALTAGAVGYLQKYSGKEDLLRAVKDVAEGRYLMPADTIRRVISGIRAAEREKPDRPDRLTQREREILTLFSQGQSYAKIAEIRGNQPLTIRNAIYGIQDKLGIETKQELVVWAVRSGLLDDIEPSD